MHVQCRDAYECRYLHACFFVAYAFIFVPGRTFSFCLFRVRPHFSLRTRSHPEHVEKREGGCI